MEGLKESSPKARIEIEPGYETFVPGEFAHDPLSYFEANGKNIKSGDVKHDEVGRVREDPTAVKELPMWINPQGVQLRVIGKRVNASKAMIAESNDPFYEYRIMELVKKAGLPVSSPVVKAEQGGTHLIIMEKAEGVSWYKRNTLKLKEKGYSVEDVEELKRQAEEQMNQLRIKFESAGIQRGWKLKDMIFDIDIENKKIRKITPVDWERTKIDQGKLMAYKKLAQVG